MTIGDEQIDDMIETYEKVTKRADLFHAQAKHSKAFIDAHTKAGFTREEALTIFVSTHQTLKGK